MFYLFFFLLFIMFMGCGFLGLMLEESNSLNLEILLPYGALSEMPFSFSLDYVSFFFFSAVSLISSVIFLYSKFYMDEETFLKNLDNSRFFSLLFLFVLSMMFLVFSSSWVVVMLGWDGLGVVSFLLVIYYNNSASLDSGLITVFMNRVGDCLFILSLIFMFSVGWVNQDFLSPYGAFFFGLVIFMGCITKSAQVPYSSWLPAAMAAPTPVSSLVHSSTLVTAGVYLMVRFNYMLEEVLYVFSFLSLMTMVLAGVCAVWELDFKKVVAMSTLSQLGFMVFSITLGYWLLAFFHVLFHAFFKSSLFLSTGNLMHYLGGCQDSRKFGALGASFYSKLVFMMSSLSLMGFPFTLGFYSKDTILGSTGYSSLDLLTMGYLLGCIFTVSYSVRLFYMGFFLFPSFGPSMGFVESKYFYFSVSILFMATIFLGNFFFTSFFPPLVLSGVDLFVGLLIISSGVVFYSACEDGYLVLLATSSILFLSLFSSTGLSKYTSSVQYSKELKWGEVLGGKGILGLLAHLGVSFGRFYLVYFTLLGVLWALLSHIL